MTITKTISAIAAAAIGAAVILAFSPRVEAGTGTHSPAVKGDRLDVRLTGMACSQRAWPYYEPQCLRDAKNVHGQARAVRIVSTDNVAFAH